MSNPIEGKRYVYIGDRPIKLYYTDIFSYSPNSPKGRKGDTFIARKYVPKGGIHFIYENNDLFATEWSHVIHLSMHKKWDELFILEEEYYAEPTEHQLSIHHVADILEDTLQATNCETIANNLKLCIDTLRREGY